MFCTESAFCTEFDPVWVNRMKSNSVRPKCNSHVILFPAIHLHYIVMVILPSTILPTDPNSNPNSNPNPTVTPNPN